MTYFILFLKKADELPSSDEANKITPMLLLETPNKVNSSIGSPQKLKSFFLLAEQIKTRVVDVAILYTACDIYRKGETIWKHINIKAEKNKFIKLRQQTTVR